MSVTPPPPPRVLVGAAVVVLGVATTLAVLGAIGTGVTTDEPIHVMRLRNLFDTGWYAVDWDYGANGPGGGDGNVYVYGPVTMLLLHGWSVLWGVEGWGEVATSAHAYDVRHLGVVVIGLVGLAATAAIGRVLLRYWRWGIVAAAALAVVPSWTGHQMFNVKDIPVATGHTLVTLALLLYVGPATPRRGRRLARGAVLVAGLVLTLGTRPGMWTGLAVLSVLALVGVVHLRLGRRRTLVTLAELAAAHLVAAAGLVAIYPNLFGSPLRALARTGTASSGVLDETSPDRLYVLEHLAEEVPTLVLLFMLSGAVVAAVALVRGRRDDPVLASRVALVGAQAFAVPVAAVVLGSDLYHGLRQLLFVLPALAVLAAWGVAWWQSRPALLRRPRLVTAVAVVSLGLPIADQVTLQPYQTTYVNLATDVLADGPPDERPSSDYWRVSIPELIDGARLDHQLLCKSFTAVDSELAQPFANAGATFSTSRSTDCREEANGPLAPTGLPVVRRLPVTQFDAVFIGPPPPNCTPLDQVSRWRHGYEVVLSTLARCLVAPAPLTGAGVRADARVLGTAMPGDLWLYATDGWMQWPGRLALTAPVPSAGLAFRTDASCAARGCTLVVRGSGPDDIAATVDGRMTTVARGPAGALRVHIPSEQADDLVWVRLVRRSGAPLDVRMTGLVLRPTRATAGAA